MPTRNWISRLQATLGRHRRPIRRRRVTHAAAHPAGTSFVPAAEVLEDRTLLTAYVVDTIADDPLATAADTDGLVSLREAIQAANTNAVFGDAAAGDGGGLVDTITFHPSLSGQTIVLGGAELTISDDLSLTGLGTDDLTISGNDTSGVLTIGTNAIVEISGITIAHGRQFSGGGINNAGVLTLTDSVLKNNLAGLGAAIANEGAVTLIDNVLTDNRAGEGTIWNAGTLNITNSTVADNLVTSDGGGLWNNGTATISDSVFSSNSSLSGHGGGIRNSVGGVLEVASTTFSDNSASNGGAISNLGTATIDSSAFSSNTGQTGGAIWNIGMLDAVDLLFSENSATSVGGAIRNRGTLVVSESRFLNNSTVLRDTNGNGGAIGNTNGGTVIVSNSMFEANAAGTGGAIDNFGAFPGSFGTLEITSSRFLGNSSDFTGGAIWSDDPTIITASTFTGNTAGTFGGAIHIRFDSLTIADSTISNNSATFGGGVDIWDADVEVTHSTISENSSVLEGGGIENFFGTLEIINSTISGNSTEGDGGGVWNLGAMTVTNSTITGNRADADGDGVGSGGGIFDDGSSVLSLLNNTIVAGNLLGAEGADSPDDIVGLLDPLSAHNLIGDAATSGGLTHGVNGNIVGNAGVGTIDITTVLDTTLADNGGPTPTHALVAGSLAIDAGDNSLVSTATDQTGSVRILDGNGDGIAIVDIGAVELVTTSGVFTFLSDQIEDLGEVGVLNFGAETSLLMLLTQAENQYEAQNIAGSTSLLEAFLVRVRTLRDLGKLDPDQAASLISSAEPLLEELATV